ncbi:hypothetical protein ACFL6S_25740 [Candidatus Poribacteria bacterium]
MLHCQLLQAGEIQAIVGDASRDGVGGPQYCGLWSLTSKHRQFNAFGNSYAGLLPGEIRGKSPELRLVDDSTCALVRATDEERPVEVCATYQIVAPYYIDHHLTFQDKKDMRGTGCDFREVSWCCYMNCPEDSRIHFLSQGEWFRYISPEHGVASNIAPSYIPESELEVFPERQGRRPFHWDRAARRFDESFYYGRLGDMVLILIFNTPLWLRFFCSPTGGGGSLLPGQHCPAWDFEWIIPANAYEINREYHLRVRLVYKKFISDDDVLEEYRKAQETLGFRLVAGE